MSYSGALTPAWSRFLVLFRYSRKSLFRSKLQTALFVLCFFYPLACVLIIYLSHSLTLPESLGNGPFVKIDNEFFLYFMTVQGALAFVLTAFTGPGLVFPALPRGGLPFFF